MSAEFIVWLAGGHVIICIMLSQLKLGERAKPIDISLSINELKYAYNYIWWKFRRMYVVMQAEYAEIVLLKLTTCRFLHSFWRPVVNPSHSLNDSIIQWCWRRGGRGGNCPPTFWTCVHRKWRKDFFVQYVSYSTKSVLSMKQMFLPQIAPKAVSEYKSTKKFLGACPQTPLENN